MKCCSCINPRNDTFSITYAQAWKQFKCPPSGKWINSSIGKGVVRLANIDIFHVFVSKVFFVKGIRLKNKNKKLKAFKKQVECTQGIQWLKWRSKCNLMSVKECLGAWGLIGIPFLLVATRISACIKTHKSVCQDMNVGAGEMVQ